MMFALRNFPICTAFSVFPSRLFLILSMDLICGQAFQIKPVRVEPRSLFKGYVQFLASHEGHRTSERLIKSQKDPTRQRWSANLYNSAIRVAGSG